MTSAEAHVKKFRKELHSGIAAMVLLALLAAGMSTLDGILVALSAMDYPGEVNLAGVALVDSGEGIARRTAFLTQGQEWPADPQGIAVFTRDDPDLVELRPALADYGLSETRFL